MSKLCLALLVLLATLAVAYAATDVSIVSDGRITLTALTPIAVGTPSGRVELRIKNDDGAAAFFCGGTPGALSSTPGPNSGFQYDSGREVTEFVFPEKPVYCLSPSGNPIISYHEARIVTATPTNTP